MSRIAIVTDSGAHIPPELLEGYSIHFVPFQLNWGDKSYLEGVNLDQHEFYDRLANSTEFPSTSQPAPAAFYQVFSDLIKQGYKVLSILTSSRLSGTFSSAAQASKMLPNAEVELVDSGTASMEMGFHVLAAARAAIQGASLAECKAVAEKARSHTGVYFLVNTLDYLQRGGRIGGAAAFLGNLLNIKPILHIRNGRVEVVGKVRTMRKAVDDLLDIVHARVQNMRPLRISALYANEPERATHLLDSALQRFTRGALEVKEAFCTTISPVIGTHTGPDGVGLAYMAGM